MLQELIEKRAALDRQITATKAEMLADATTNAIACFTGVGFTTDEALTQLTGVGFTTDEALTQLTKRFNTGVRKTGAKVAPKYRQTHGGSATWSGRGVQPRWFKSGDFEAV